MSTNEQTPYGTYTFRLSHFLSTEGSVVFQNPLECLRTNKAFRPNGTRFPTARP